MTFDEQHGPRVQLPTIATITIHAHEDFDAIVHRQIQDLLSDGMLVDDDVLPTDLVENEYSRMSRRALSAWGKFADTFLVVTEVLANHTINSEQFPISGKGIMVATKESVVRVLTKQIAIWDDFSERFEEYRGSLEDSLDESKDDLVTGMNAIKTLSNPNPNTEDQGNGVGVDSDKKQKIVLELSHIVKLYESKLTNTIEYRETLSTFYMHTCGIFARSVVIEVQALKKSLRSLKTTTGPLSKQVDTMRVQKESFCKKEAASLAVINKHVKKHLIPLAPMWFGDWLGVATSGLAPIQAMHQQDTIDSLSNSFHGIAAQMSFWLQEMRQRQSDADATAKKKRGRKTHVPAPPVHLNTFHKIINDVEQSIEAGNRSLMAFWVNEKADGTPIQDAISKLKTLAVDLDKQRITEQEALVAAIEKVAKLAAAGGDASIADSSDLVDAIQEILDSLNAKLGLMNVMEYAANQSLVSIRAKITTFIHNECNKANTAIRITKAQLKAKIEHRTRELRPKIAADTELQRNISLHYITLNEILDSILDEDEFADTVRHISAVIKRRYALKGVYQDLCFVDKVRENAKSEYETLLNKFESW